MSKRRQTFGQILREARLAKGITLRKFAEMVGISPTYLSQVELGNVDPPTARRTCSTESCSRVTSAARPRGRCRWNGRPTASRRAC